MEGARAEGVDVIDDRFRRRALEREDLVAVDAEQQRDGVVLGQRNAENRLAGRAGGRVLGRVELGVVELAPPQVVAQRHAAVGEVRVHEGERVALQVDVALCFDRDPVAAAEEVVLRQLHRRGHTRQLRVAEAEGEAARGRLGDAEHHVHFVIAARHRLGFHVDAARFEIAQALQADLGAVDRGLRIPAALELAHLAAHHLVRGAVVALELHTTHLHARPGHDLQVDGDGAVLAVDLRNRIDLGEGVADVAQRRDDGIRAQLEQGAREHLVLLHEDARADLLLGQHRIAGDLHVRHLVDLAFGDAGGDVHVGLVGADRDLDAVFAEIDVAAVEVEVVQLLAVAFQLLARILVVAAVPAEPVGLARFPVVGQRVEVVDLVADDVDVADLGRPAFLDVDRDVDPVAVQARHRRRDAHVVLAAVVVLAHQLLGHAVEIEAVEGFAFGQADVVEAAGQVLGLDVLVAGQGQAIDRRTLGDREHQDVALACDLDVLEEPGAVERAHRFGNARRVDGVAAFHRQVGEHRAGADTLQAVDADVADGERTRGGRRQRRQRGRIHGRVGRRLGPGRSGNRRGEGKGKQSAVGKSRHSLDPSGKGVPARCSAGIRVGSRPSAPVAGCRCRTPGPSGWPAGPVPRIARLPSRAHSRGCL